ncbi:hypothetical protein [Burkholderia pseudomallei]|uniref:hypothetical protein n=1 Tax=Burkholderia pseudomallei TaxID=28450 RepID=UPI000F15F257|nr:hypothetical protein [Burkholderia pseudomallei]CAJ3075000.1 Uncharacterised protein [Burkholderia pseudomallei]VCK79923.1 Uncharacterised protein [Burkholderia pseudomallei]VCK80709.1 Uncharacterised protein [Burkholderia pseudomallei]VCK83797.1 Uncharacterised protein [Burkholderia pseudomallei]VCK85127.1 Uncharacterised protein [Burkholderia pseudomallei]
MKAALAANISAPAHVRVHALGATAREEWASFLIGEGAVELARELWLDGASDTQQRGEAGQSFERLCARAAGQ